MGTLVLACERRVQGNADCALRAVDYQHTKRETERELKLRAQATSARTNNAASVVKKKHPAITTTTTAMELQ